MGVLETVKIVSKNSEHGYLVINKSDLTNKHELFVAKKIQPKVAKLKVVEPKVVETPAKAKEAKTEPKAKPKK